MTQNPNTSKDTAEEPGIPPPGSSRVRVPMPRRRWRFPRWTGLEGDWVTEGPEDPLAGEDWPEE